MIDLTGIEDIDDALAVDIALQEVADIEGRLLEEFMGALLLED